MSIPKARKPNESSSRSRKRPHQSQPTATSTAVSARSSKKTSKISPAPENVPLLLPHNHIVPPDFNKILLVDVGDPLDWSMVHKMALVIEIDYKNDIFSVIKNRFGQNNWTYPLSLFITFIYNPEIHDQYELYKIHFNKTNEAACTAPEQ